MAVVGVFLIGCAVLLVIGCAGARSGAPQEKQQGHTEVTNKEQTRPPEATASEETTALGETTAFQAPEGTRTSSTARVVCLRAEQGVPPPTKGTEALEDGVLTRVLTPKVEAQPDGVHLQIDNRIGKAPGYVFSVAKATNLESYESGGSLFRKGINNDVTDAPPGIAEIQCFTQPRRYDYNEKYAYFEIVVGDSGYKSPELECRLGSEPMGAGGADIGGYTGSNPVAKARADFSEQLKESDVVEEAGYPQVPSPPVRVVRAGQVVARIDYSASGYGVTYCDGQF
jgi:hypothetical protein